MYVLYEDSGKLKAAKIFSSADTSLQIESASGKRSKIKRNNTLFEFASPEPEALLEQAQALAAELDIDFLWECAPQAEFEAAELAQEYFGTNPDAVQKTAMIMALASAPAYFHRRGRGAYKPAPADILKAALAAIEKKRLKAEQQQQLTAAMLEYKLPSELINSAKNFLDKPDKNSLEWKAFDAACAQITISPEQFLLNMGVWPNPLVMMRERFFNKYFPAGIDWPEVKTPALTQELKHNQVLAYSVDDASTTEIDDALSCELLDTETIRVGIHIAAPALAIARDSTIDQHARARMSTVYMPGQKIPMLPASLIEQFSLKAGQWQPALSLYVTGSLNSGEVIAIESKLESIKVAANLRHEDFGSLTAAAITDDSQPVPYSEWLRPLWQFALLLNEKRAEVRGKPENNDRVEYTFVLDGNPADPDAKISLVPRKRNSPLDLMIAEYMILANSQWGGFLAQHGVPGIYRSQQFGRTRMSTQALPHESIAVPQYIWSTSPLRRYVDLVNQRQIIAATEHGVSARLVAPFKPKDADLYALIGAFDAQYSAWGEFQSSIERYWCIRWLQQQNIKQVQAHIIRENLVRFACAPFITRINGLPELERGSEITLELLAFDELGLDIECRLNIN